MSERSDKVRLIDMIDAAQRIVDSLQDQSLEMFLEDMDKRDAVTYRLQIIGEAAYKLSDQLKKAHPSLEWLKIQGLRHKIVHDYYALDDRTIYNIGRNYVPALMTRLTEILESWSE